MQANMQANFINNNQYNNSSLKRPAIIRGGTTLEVCTEIFRRLIEYYTEPGNNAFECRTIAKLFYRALQEYVNPSFTPQFFERVEDIQPINDNQVIILYIPPVIADYHYIVACKNDQNNYIVFSAFGARFIDPFIVEEGEFINSSRRLLGKTSNRQYRDNFNEIEFVQDWNRIINVPFEDYFDDNLDRANHPESDSEDDPDYDLEDEEMTKEDYWNDIFKRYEEYAHPIQKPICILTRQQ